MIRYLSRRSQTPGKLQMLPPIPKSGDPSAPSNYRPISLLSLVSKVLEQIIYNRISDFLHTNKLLTNRQFGFLDLRGSSPETRSWFQLLSKHKQVACVFFWCQKSSVPQGTILTALSTIGIRGPLLHWLQDYLSGRQQRVVLDGTTSKLANVTSGVP